MISCYITSRYIAVNKAYTEWYTYIITYFNVLFSFVIGAVFHRQVEKGKGSIPFLHSHKLTTFAILMTLIIINFFISSAATAYIFEFSYIFLLLHLTFNGYYKTILYSNGKQSMVMWLTHSFFCYHIFHDFIYGFRYPLVIYVVLIIISYVVSIPISYIAKLIIQRIPLLRS